MFKWKNKGFLLLEVMVAVTILATGLVFVVRSYAGSIQAIRFSQRLLTANLLLEEKIWQRQEELVRAGSVDPGRYTDRFSSPFEDFEYTLDFIEEDAQPSLYRSDFTVSWQQRSGKHNVSSVSFARGPVE